MTSDPHFTYIAAAYGLTFLILSWLIVSSLITHRRLKRQLDSDDDA